MWHDLPDGLPADRHGSQVLKTRHTPLNYLYTFDIPYYINWNADDTDNADFRACLTAVRDFLRLVHIITCK
jgi:hypothetical protein